MKKNLTWSFYQAWNSGLELARGVREAKPRDVLWASDLGKSYVDVYLSLKGEKPSNDFSFTTLRKFDAGIIWENILGVILKRVGIFKDAQGWVDYQLPKCLKVVGRYDFLAGGKIDEEKAYSELENLKELLPENVFEASKIIIKNLAGKELKEIIFEVKTVSSFMFDKYMTSGKANPNHRLQLLHYLLATNRKEGHIVYISKDDARMLEVGVFNPSFVNEEYEKFVKEISQYYFSNEMPPKEKEIIFDDEWGKFSLNWRVLYSRYLTKVYGYKDQEEVRKKFEPLVSRWNRVLSRIKNKKNITKNNLKALDEIKGFGFNIDEVIEKIQHKEPEIDELEVEDFEE